MCHLTNFAYIDTYIDTYKDEKTQEKQGLRLVDLGINLILYTRFKFSNLLSKNSLAYKNKHNFEKLLY